MPTRAISTATPRPSQAISRQQTATQQNNRKKTSLLLRILKVGLLVIATIALIITQGPITLAGFFVGLAFQPQMRSAIDRIKTLWKEKPWEMIGITIVASIINFTIPFIAVAFTHGSYLGVLAAEARRSRRTQGRG